MSEATTSAGDGRAPRRRPRGALWLGWGLAIATAVLGLNLLGDGLRDLFDPRLSRER